jgi:endopolyphosphatase
LHQEIELAKSVRAASPGKGGNKKKGNKKKGKGNKPKDPSLVIPDPPSQTAIPGPAYSMQPLTLTGYTQYFSNLTDINNLPADSDPKRKKKPEAKEFNFEVQYSTFTDKVFKLTDLTVRNYVRLAFRMGLAAADEQKAKNPSRSVQDDPDDDDFEDEDKDDEGADSPDDDDVEEESELVECESVDGTALKKKDKKRRKKESDRAWRRFVKYAFVSTGVEETYNLIGARRDGDDE